MMFECESPAGATKTTLVKASAIALWIAERFQLGATLCTDDIYPPENIRVQKFVCKKYYCGIVSIVDTKKH